MTRVGCFVLAATVAGWCWPRTGAAEGPPKALLEPDALLRIAAIRPVGINGEGLLSVALEPLDRGRRVVYVVPNLPGAPDPNTFDSLPDSLRSVATSWHGFNPLPGVFGPLKKLGVGAVVRARIAAGDNGIELVGIEAVPHLAGEETPTGYVFVRTTTIAHEGKDYVVVHVTKFSRPEAFIVPLSMYDRKQGKLVPDPALTAALARTEAGAVVDVQAEDRRIAGHPVIRRLREYRPTRTGRFIDLTPDANGQPHVRIQVGEETVTVPWRAEDDPDPHPMSPFPVGRTVRFTTTAGDAPSLRSIDLDGSFYEDEGKGAYVVTSGGVTLKVERTFRRGRFSSRAGCCESSSTESKPGWCSLAGRSLSWLRWSPWTAGGVSPIRSPTSPAPRMGAPSTPCPKSRRP